MCSVREALRRPEDYPRIGHVWNEEQQSDAAEILALSQITLSEAAVLQLTRSFKPSSSSSVPSKSICAKVSKESQVLARGQISLEGMHSAILARMKDCCAAV